MKKILLFICAATLLVLLFGCVGGRTAVVDTNILAMVPGSTIMMIDINVGELMKKNSGKLFPVDQLMRSAGDMVKILTEGIADPATVGIANDKNAIIFAFDGSSYFADETRSSAKSMVWGAAFSLDDSEKFVASFITPFATESQLSVETAGDYQQLLIDNVNFFWDTNKLFITIAENNYLFEDGFKLEQYQAVMTADGYITDNSAFANFQEFSGTGDIIFWMDYDGYFQLLNIVGSNASAGLPLDFSTFFTPVENTSIIAALNFNAGQMLLDTYVYNIDEKYNILSSGSFDQNLLAHVPAEPLLFMGVKVDWTKLYNLFLGEGNSFGISSADFDAMLGGMLDGMTTADVFNKMGGEIVISLGHSINVDEAVRGSFPLNLYIAMDEDLYIALDNLTALLAMMGISVNDQGDMKNVNVQGFNIYYSYNAGALMLSITADDMRQMIDGYQESLADSGSYAVDKIVSDNNAYSLNVTAYKQQLNQLLTMIMGYSADLSFLELIDSIEAGNKNGGSPQRGEFIVNFSDKNSNSLALLSDFIVKIARP